LWLFLAAVEGATTEIGRGNALDLESLGSEFQFVELGRRVEEFVSHQLYVEAIRLKSVILDLQRQLVRHDWELCQLTEASGWARAEENFRERSKNSRESGDTSATRSRSCRRHSGKYGVK
jgi:hypothetical protein